MDLAKRAAGALMGLAVGDALGSPAEGKTPAEIAQRWGRLTDFLVDQPAGTDDTEYALFSARLLLRHGLSLSSEQVAQAWRDEIISAANEYKGAGFSEILTIKNLQRGLQPPFSGQHLHSWSDGLAMRAAPYGIAAAGDPELAADLAESDGHVSHAGEGILGGRAVAAAVAAAMTAADCDEALGAALHVIPADSWCGRNLREGIAIGRQSADVWQAIAPLHETLVLQFYHWPDLAPEAVGLAFGMLAAARGDFETAVLGSVNLGRDADTIAAIAGAIAGALHGCDRIPARWSARIAHARGGCIQTVKGMSVLQTAAELAGLAAGRRTR
ncbi:ADP-ribosylglycohydrolase family protein [candidate division KSB1 bacterium]|nr:ADP-ribosylglycohydrolase family protein [bacterium]NUM65580.1 ADP-ribosylglycohydrolase family protein [candidate division KSB1 bacterium]